MYNTCQTSVWRINKGRDLSNVSLKNDQHRTYKMKGNGPNHINYVWSGHLCGVWSVACYCECGFPKEMVKTWVKSWVQIGSGPYVYVWVDTHFQVFFRVNQVSSVDTHHSTTLHTQESSTQQSESKSDHSFKSCTRPKIDQNRVCHTLNEEVTQCLKTWNSSTRKNWDMPDSALESPTLGLSNDLQISSGEWKLMILH